MEKQKNAHTGTTQATKVALTPDIHTREDSNSWRVIRKRPVFLYEGDRVVFEFRGGVLTYEVIEAPSMEPEDPSLVGIL